MAIEIHRVTLISVTGESTAAEFALNDSKSEYELTLRFLDNELRSSESDYFEAMCRLREQLEPFGLQPYCYGASKNVFPSGMGRDMGAGLKAYKLRLGERTKMEDLVSIFDSGLDVEPARVAEQRTFFEQWLKSLK